MAEIKFHSPAVFVKDVSVSREFYERIFGQKAVMNVGDDYVAFEGGFALWDAEHAKGVIYGQVSDRDRKFAPGGFEFYFESRELEKAQEDLKKAGVEFIHEVHEHPWGQRGFRVHDPDGHIVEVGEPMDVVAKRFLDQGMSREQVAKRILMPAEFVNKVADGQTDKG